MAEPSQKTTKRKNNALREEHQNFWKGKRSRHCAHLNTEYPVLGVGLGSSFFEGEGAISFGLWPSVHVGVASISKLRKKLRATSTVLESETARRIFGLQRQKEQ
jgi:hypothetical protein